MKPVLDLMFAGWCLGIGFAAGCGLLIVFIDGSARAILWLFKKLFRHGGAS